MTKKEYKIQRALGTLDANVEECETVSLIGPLRSTSYFINVPEEFQDLVKNIMCSSNFSNFIMDQIEDQLE